MIPKTMKAIVCDAPNHAEVREMTTPVPQAGEVLVNVKKALICTWEQRIFTGNDMPLPYVPGHEISGVVAAIPEGTVTDLQVGDKVVVKTYDSCGQCENCYRGMDNLCTGKKKTRVYDGIPGTGGFAQYIAIGSERVYKLPSGDKADLSVCAFAEPLACCIHSLEQADIQLGEDVVIVGGGIMGQLHNVLAKLRGARTILVEPDEGRREMALMRGADVTINPMETDAVEEIIKLTNGHGAHVCFFTVNSLKLAQDYIESIGKGCRLVYYGSFHPNGPIDMNPNNIHYSEKRITGSYSPTAKAFWTASHLLGYNLVDVAPFITESYPMDDCMTAFQRAMSMETYRVLIDLE
ncbi:MAG: alcohol dehydrogenase catalytic domain-containing protein [Clostridiales bacterium]|nr:alcohol dehydrogenase catalytic domain-containing protein [Clostridiales bacterium]